MRVFCDVDVREDSSDLAFFVNNECHSLRVRTIFTQSSVGSRDLLVVIADQWKVQAILSLKLLVRFDSVHANTRPYRHEGAKYLA